MRYILWIGLIAVIVFRYLSTNETYTDGQRLRITSTIYSEPIDYDDNQGIEVAGLRAYVPRYPLIQYQDRIVIEGTVKDGQLKDQVVLSIQKSDFIFVKLRNRLIAFIKAALPEPHASLIAGVVLGSKRGIPKVFWESLTKTSTAHVVVASGMNVTLLAGFLLSSLVTFVSRKKAVMVALIGVWVYAFLAGFDAPIVRAAIMGSIAFGAQSLGRMSQAVYALFLSAGAMLVVNPLWLTDLGFILSFSATLSLILFEAKVSKRLQVIPAIVRNDLSTSIAAQILVSPILFLAFGQINLLSPLINALVLWTIPPLTIIGMIASLLSLIIGSLATYVLYLTYPLSEWFVRIVGFFGMI